MNFISGMLLGFALFMWIDWGAPHTQQSIEARKIIEQCEKDLPRSQKCELTARPAEKVNENQSTNNN